MATGQQTTNVSGSNLIPKERQCNKSCLILNPYNIREVIKKADLVIGAVLIAGAKAPKLITKEMLKLIIMS